jgi:hypothetical protein
MKSFYVATILVCLDCVLLGYIVGRWSVQSANGLLDAGFTITDTDGFEVRRFDDGPRAVGEFIADSLCRQTEANPFR